MPKREDIYVRIGQRIAEARSEMQLTQAELGEKMGVSDGAVARWENATNRVHIVELRKIAAIVNRPVWWLLGESAPSESGTFFHHFQQLPADVRDQVVEYVRFLRGRHGGTDAGQ